MFEGLGLFGLSVLPGALLILYYRKKDVLEAEPWRALVITFILGALTTVPAGAIEMWMGHEPQKNDLTAVVFHYVFVVALTEELAKLSAIYLYSARHSAFNEVTDGIVYGAAAAAGFATLENIFYVFEHGFGVGILRAVLSVPSHVFEGAILGYAVAQVRVAGRSFLWIPAGLAITVIGHGIFDSALDYDSGTHFYAAALAVLLLGALTTLLLRSALQFDAAATRRTLPPTDGPDQPETTGQLVITRTLGAGLLALAVLSFIFALFFLLGTGMMFKSGDANATTAAVLSMVPGAAGIFFFRWGLRRLQVMPKGILDRDR